MKRFKTHEVEEAGDQRMKEFLPLFVLPPSAEKMAEFASRLSREEWNFLCRDSLFLKLVNEDLEKAEKYASSLLKRPLD